MKKIFLLLGFGLLAFGTVNAQNFARYIDGDSAKTTAPYSIYREYFKKELYNEALPFWRKIYENAPLFRQQTFYDGAVIYTDLIQKSTNNDDLRQKYIDTLFQIYKKQIACHGESEYLLGKKAIDLLTYGKNADIPEAREALEKYLKLSGNNAYPYYIQTYFKLLINQYERKVVDAAFVKTKYDELTVVVDKNIAKPANQQLQAYKEVKSLLDDLYAQNFADKSDPADCAKLLEIYLKKYKENPNDLATITTVYNKTKGCADSATNVELLVKLNQLDPNYTFATRLANIYIKDKKVDEAFTLYKNALAKETDNSKKSDLYYYMAFMKYMKEDFSASRDFAKEAIAWNAKNIRATNLIATLYLSSGSLCGPGTGFQSQIVLWPAFDYFNKTIEIGGDEEVVAEAKKYIAEYAKYLPTKADIAAKKLSIGAPYTVKCWINETTTVKTKENYSIYKTINISSIESNVLVTNIDKFGTIKVKFESSTGTKAIPIKVNDLGEIDFIFDTGASETTVTSDVVSVLIRQKVISLSDFLPGKLYKLADGTIVKSERFLIKKLEIGGVIFKNVEAGIVPSSSEPLLGQNVLGRFKKITQDNEKGYLFLELK